MTRAFEISVFAAMALCLHLAFAVTFSRSEGLTSSGAGGEALITLEAAPPQIETLVAAWERPPETAQSVLSPRPDMPAPQTQRAPKVQAVIERTARPARPEMIALPSANAPPKAPMVDTAPAPEPEDLSAFAVSVSKRPAARPAPPAEKQAAKAPAKTSVRPAEAAKTRAKPARKAQTASEGSAAQKAAGAGGGRQAGQSGAQSAATLSKGQQARLISVWGGQIRARIDRAKRAPSGARLRGRVVLRLTVQPSGSISAVSIAKSSGHKALDQAAIGAVKRAGRFARAPKGLEKPNYTFTLPIAFN